MNWQLLEKYKPLFKKHWLPLGLGLLGVIFFIYGLIALVGSSNSSNNIVFESGDSANSTESAKEIFVDVEGAVVKPGVYSLSNNARVQDALVAAGGLASSADRAWVAKGLNLALKVKDGTKIYIPVEGESIKGTTPLRQGFEGQAGIEGNENQININSASEQELDTLSGIGPVTAQKIIGARPYNSIDELLSKKVVSNSVFEKIKEKISIY